MNKYRADKQIPKSILITHLDPIYLDFLGVIRWAEHRTLDMYILRPHKKTISLKFLTFKAFPVGNNSEIIIQKQAGIYRIVGHLGLNLLNKMLRRIVVVH